MTRSEQTRESGAGDWRDDPRVGDVIRARNPPRGSVPVRRIIGVSADRIETSGLTGGQRNGWMSRAALTRYDLVRREGS